MAYSLHLNENFSIYRKHGLIGLWRRNEAYDYYAAIEYLPEGGKLTVRKLIEWAELAGVEPTKALDAYVAMIRKGGNGMIPRPDFELSINI